MLITPGEALRERIRQAVDSITEDFRRRGYFPSAVISVFTHHDTLYRAAFGDVTTDTLFDVASLTKIATATQVLLLIDQRKFGLEDRILKLLPKMAQWPGLAKRLQNVTVEKLLTHTSGLVAWYPLYAKEGDLYAVLNEILSLYEPREGVEYSDINFIILGRLVEEIMQLPLSQCVQALLSRSLSLSGFCYCPDSSLPIAPSSYGNPIEEEMCRERGIVFSGWRSHETVKGQVNDGNAFYYFKGVAGHAGLFSDVASYEALCRLYLNTGSPLLQCAMEEQAPGRGLGFQVGDMYPMGCGHTGFTGTAIYISRAKDLGVVAFTNRLYYEERNQNGTNDYRRALFQALADCVAP